MIPLHHTLLVEENIGLEQLPDHMKARAFKLIVEIPLEPLEEEEKDTSASEAQVKVSIKVLTGFPLTLVKSRRA